MLIICYEATLLVFLIEFKESGNNNILLALLKQHY